MHFQKILFADSIKPEDAKKIHETFQDCNGADEIFFSHTKQEFLSKLNKNYTAYAVGANLENIIAKFSEPLADEKNLAFAVIAESKILYGSKTAEKIADILYEQNYVDEEAKQNFRLILHEALINAIEHGNLKLSSEDDKSTNPESWFNDYYEKANKLLAETPAGEKLVSILVFSKEDHLELWVEDEGEGFDTDKLYNNIDVENPYGKGLSIAAALSDSITHQKNEALCQFSIKTHHQQDRFTPPSLSSAKKHGYVLLVDDQQSNLNLIFYILKNAGYRNIATANSGQQAIEQVNSQKPDLILMDVNMPDMTGFEAYDKLKTNPATANIPVIFLSGLTNLETRTQAFKLGAVDFISKNTDKTEILARTNVHILHSIAFKAMNDFSNRLIDNLESARKFQANLMPSPEKITRINKNLPVEIEAEYQPCDELAGDYWSIFETKGNIVGFTMVDFTGHGVAAALDTVRLHAIFHELEQLWGSPEALTRSLNHRLCKMLELGKFATFVYGIINIDNGNVTLVCCGSPPIGLIKNNSDDIKLLDASGIPLGLIDDSDTELNIHHFTMNKDETIFLYSDALVETPHKNKKLWMDDNNEELIKAWRRSSKQNGSLIQNTLRKFNKTANKPLKDDLTLLTIKYNGPVI